MSYKLNTKDLYTVYGIIVNPGNDDFLKLPKRKGSIENNWQDENGLDIDLSQPRFEAREFVLKCTLEAVSRADFWSKYNGFFTELSGVGVHLLYVPDLDKTFTLFYKEQNNFKKLTALDNNAVYIQFDIVFGETNPTLNITPEYLVDSDDNFLIR